MANTTFRHLYITSVIQGDIEDEEIIGCLGDGLAIPGDQVHIGSDRKIVLSDDAAVELWTGIVIEHPTLGTETAITNSLPCNVVKPKSGKRYAIRIIDQSGTKEIGYDLKVSSTAGKCTALGDVALEAKYSLAKPIASGDTIAIVYKN